ncbi:hypothetical protein CRG98_036986 [Punica granatum]|uniref:Uncharacterized protein n=1 Tax=Punica granatum TaxID=22663 RepID=A0A2I0IFP6_PUNGR|nr:hypothetical protein CRG98_036986 [Punica granatum]
MPRSRDEGSELWGSVPMYPEESGIRVCRGFRLCCTFSLVRPSPQLEVATCYMGQTRVRREKMPLRIPDRTCVQRNGNLQRTSVALSRRDCDA